MKSSLIPIACGTALALMAGAAASHWTTVQDMATLAAVLPANLTPAKSPPPAIAPLPDDSLAREAKSLLAEARRDSLEKSASVSATPANGTDARLEKLMTLVEGAVEQNQYLRDIISTNTRDMLELQMRVDGFDGQFRPLVVEQEPMSPYDDGSGGVLPPLE